MNNVNHQEKLVFGTNFGTKKIFVTPKHHFNIKKYKDKEGNSLIYLDVSDKKDRIRVSTPVAVPAENWNKEKRKVIGHPEAGTMNLILENINAKLTVIKTNYLLRSIPLTAKLLIEEFESKTADLDFISFCKNQLALLKVNFKHQTVKNHTSVIKKLEDFQPSIPFHKIDADLFLRYKKHYNYNAEITYQSDMKTIKRYLKLAVKKGYQINLDLEEVKVNVTSKRIYYLFPEMVRKLINYYYSENIPKTQLDALGYLLTSCYTGMRVSDIKTKKRPELLGDIFQFNHQKTDNFQSMKLNDDAKEIVRYNPDLFKTKFVEQSVNRNLKTVAEKCGIPFPLSMHIGRHTFATTVYRNTKDLLLTKKLLGHSNIRHTMVYVHIVEGEELQAVDAVKF